MQHKIKDMWRACNLNPFSPCLTGPVEYPFASRHKGPGFKTPRGDLCETGILLSALSLYIGNPDVIDHFCGLVWGVPRPKPSRGPRADNVIILLDVILIQLFCPGFTLAAGPPSGFTTTESAAGGEPCGEPAISLHSHHVSLVQWTPRLLPITRYLGSIPLGGTYVNRDSPVSIVSLQINVLQNHEKLFLYLFFRILVSISDFFLVPFWRQYV
jgi:hypothetical protein